MTRPTPKLILPPEWSMNELIALKNPGEHIQT